MKRQTTRKGGRVEESVHLYHNLPHPDEQDVLTRTDQKKIAGRRAQEKNTHTPPPAEENLKQLPPQQAVILLHTARAHRLFWRIYRLQGSSHYSVHGGEHLV